MLSLFDSANACNRRDFLRIGTLGLGGLSLTHLLAARAAAAQGKSPLTDKAAIFVFMHGGPSQFETFDPKMSAAREYRSVTGEIATSLPGITFGATFPRLAKLANKLTVVRSFMPDNANHNSQPVVHPDTLDANLGSLYARVAGLNHATTGLPTNVLLTTQSIEPDAHPIFPGHGSFEATGAIGKAYAPFMPGGSTDLQRNMRLKIDRARLDDRRALLTRLDSLKRHLDVSGALDAMDSHRGQAFNVILRGVADTFDLSKEDPKTLARYDTQLLFDADSVKKRLLTARPTDQATLFNKYILEHGRTLGKQLLLARRLCEAGCGFVTVNTNFVWDMHGSARAPSVVESMPTVGPVFDHAVATLIEDLEARGLSEKVLVVCCGEMGRTPRVQTDGGRDHWANLGPLLLYGGGLKMGQVIGKSTANGGDPATDPVTVKGLIATIVHTLFDVAELRLMRGISGDLAKVLTEGEPIRELIP
jgi:hypothetical protein